MESKFAEIKRWFEQSDFAEINHPEAVKYVKWLVDTVGSMVKEEQKLVAGYNFDALASTVGALVKDGWKIKVGSVQCHSKRKGGDTYDHSWTCIMERTPK